MFSNILKQYTKNKNHKYGIKLYVLSTPNGIVQKFAVFRGTLDEYSGKNHSQKIVLHLMEEKLDVGHHLHMNSFALAKILLEKKTHCTGILRTGKKYTNKEVQTEKLKKGEAVAKYAQGLW